MDRRLISINLVVIFLITLLLGNIVYGYDVVDDGRDYSIVLFEGDSVPSAPSYETFTFLGWKVAHREGYINPSETIKWYMPGDIVTEEEVILQAEYLDNKGTTVAIKLIGNGGKTEEDSEYIVTLASAWQLSSYRIQQNPFSRLGYDFVEYNTQANGNGTSYNGGGTLENGGTYLYNLYAQWEANEAFDDEEFWGDGAEEDTDIDFGEEGTEEDTDITTEENLKPELTGNVYIAGDVAVGQTLTVDVTELQYVGTEQALNYKWYVNGNLISGATTSSYAITDNEIGKTITVVVSCDNNRGEISSAQTIAVPKKIAEGTYSKTYSLLCTNIREQTLVLADFELPQDIKGASFEGIIEEATGDTDILSYYDGDSFTLSSGTLPEKTVSWTVRISSDNYQDIEATVTVITMDSNIVLVDNFVTGATLVLIKGGEGEGYTYNEMPAYRIGRYESLSVEEADSLGYPTLAGITSVYGILIEGEVEYEEAVNAIVSTVTPADVIEETHDVNGTGSVNIADAGVTFACYNKAYSYYDNLKLYLASDVDGNLKVDVNDFASIVAFYRD